VIFDLIKMRDAADWWVPDVGISEQYVCHLNFIFVGHDVGYLAFLPVKFDLISLRDAADGWVRDVRLSEKETCALLDLFCSS
jgi:hypothetical protein